MKAFPNPNRDKHPDVTKDSEGMDLRDYFAAKAMQGIINGIMPQVDVGLTVMQIDQACLDAYEVADKMMEARK